MRSDGPELESARLGGRRPQETPPHVALICRQLAVKVAQPPKLPADRKKRGAAANVSPAHALRLAAPGWSRMCADWR